MVRWITTFGLGLMLTGGVAGCGTPGPYGDISAPITIDAPALDPVTEFPAEPVWRLYWAFVDVPWRGLVRETARTDEWVNPQPGQSIADLGAGGGYFTFRYAARVGPTGHVSAVDVDWRMARKIAWEATARGVTNVSVVLAPFEDYGLGRQRFDTVLMINTGAFQNCEPERNRSYVRQIADSLRPGGRFVYTDSMRFPSSPEEPSCNAVPEAELLALFQTRFAVAQREEGGVDNPQTISYLLEVLPAP